jgi:TolB-like protein/Tfp pilus assembly protein PilF
MASGAGGEATRTAGELPLGQRFADRYQIEELLGRGGMGAVYRARDLSLGEDIALKVLTLGEEAPVAAVLRFRQEVRLARRVTHPNVARVYDIGEHEGILYLTMELIDGVTLRAALRAEDRFDAVRAARIARAICDGLAAAHAAGVIHRDLKPANILLDDAGRIVISDFGIARSLVDDMGLTVDLIGTPLYMAPEQAFPGVVDARTDLFALGIILHEMLTGARPDPSPARVAAALEEEGVSKELAAIVLRCIERDPEGRPRGAAEVARWIEEAVPESAALSEASAGASIPAESGGRARIERESRTAPSTRSPIASPPSRGYSTSLALDALGDRAIAVLPFRYRGAPEHAYLGDAIAEELIDCLSRTRGLRVLASGAALPFRDARDPLRVGRELGVAAFVEGAVHMAPERVRITTRLIDVLSGVQLWSDTHEGPLGDLFALEESIARRVAEELRVELHVLAHGEGAPDEAIERYLTARRRLQHMGPDVAPEAVADLDRSIAIAPRFAPAYAAHAMACLRSWFVSSGVESATDWERAARGSVARALERAPDIAEAHLAAAILATQSADFRAAARSLTRALAIAPTCAAAHEHLGALQCEGGQSEAGVKRMQLADQLDPTLPNPLPYIARHHALMGNHGAAQAIILEMERRHGKSHMYTCSLRIRMAAWRGDREAVGRLTLEDIERFEAPFWRPVRLYAHGVLGQLSEREVERAFARLLADSQNPRFISLLLQLQTEIHAARGELSAARLYLLRAATGMLIDIEWLDRCPLLEPLRDHPDFAEAHRRVLARASAIWAS